MAEHTCHAARCAVGVPPRMFMCKRHWFMLPKWLRDIVWAHYVPGQEITKTPSHAYLQVTNQAILYVKDKEFGL